MKTEFDTCKVCGALARDHSTKKLWEHNAMNLKHKGMNMKKTKWQDNRIQFPRLLAEIRAMGLSDSQMEALSVSMDLEAERIDELFERAETEFQKIKGA